MEGIQSYTDKLRKTYRQSLDVILPLTNHEIVVHCNDDEFESYLKEQHSPNDLQVCIHLLERHIDLQKEIIQGLTHLQEIHKYDTLSSDYNDVVENLITAQNKLAVFRSRTVRCLTKQIQQRCGDSSLQLPPWSSEKGKQTASASPDTPLTNGKPLLNEMNSLEVSKSHTNPVKTQSLDQKSRIGYNGMEITDQTNTRSGKPSLDYHENVETRPEEIDSQNSSINPIQEHRLNGVYEDPVPHLDNNRPRQDVVVSDTSSLRSCQEGNSDFIVNIVSESSSAGLSKDGKPSQVQILDDQMTNANNLDRTPGFDAGHELSGSTPDRPSHVLEDQVTNLDKLNRAQTVDVVRDSSGIKYSQGGRPSQVHVVDDQLSNLCKLDRNQTIDVVDGFPNSSSSQTERSSPASTPDKRSIYADKLDRIQISDVVPDSSSSSASQTERSFPASTPDKRSIYPDKLDRVQIVDVVSDSSSSSSSQSERRAKANTRQVVEPVDETVTVELLKSTSSNGGGGDDPGKQSSVELVESRGYSNTSYKATIIESSSSPSNPTHDAAPDELVSSSKIKTLDWDPSILIKEILGKEKPIESHQRHDSTNIDDIHMAGYLEKLPVNKKKASLLKSWRKRYFKIFHGKLFYFEDHRSTTPISFIKLAGSQVVELGNKCLEVTEREDFGGKLLVIRCTSWPELQDWRKAFEKEAKQKEKRQHFGLLPEKKQVIIIDFGSSSIKAGVLEDNAWPQVLIPSVYAVHKEKSENIHYGYDALEPLVRNVSKLIFPLRPAVTIGKFFLDPNELTGFLETIFRELQVDASHYQVIITTPVNLRDQDKERMVGIFLDVFQVAGVYMKSQAILSMYSYSATCGIVVNIGDNIDVVPIEDGYIVEPGVSSLPYGGRQVTDHFSRLLSSSGYRYFSEIENYIAEYLKIKTCYVSQDYAKELKDDANDVSITVDMSKFSLPNGNRMVSVGKERFMAYEGLFSPELWGKDTPGLADMVYQAVMACSIDSRKDMCRNIFLSGATTKIPGFPERLQSELGHKFPSSLTVQVHAAPDRQFAAFIGAAVLASLETFDDLCISSDEWEDVGPINALKKWDGV